MKTLTEYLMEETAPTLEFQIGTTDEFMDWGVWTPNDELTKDDYKKIANAFYDKYPANHNDCGEVCGIDVKCDLKYKGSSDWVQFTFYWGDADNKTRMKVIDEIANLLTNTIYSVKGGKTEIRNLLNKMTF